jgi:hypothetical protein
VERSTTHRKRVLLVCELDGYANGLRPVELERFLRKQGHEVQMVNTYYLGRASSESGSVQNKLPPLKLRRFLLYATEAASALFTRRWRFGRKRFSYHLELADYRLRRSILGSSLRLDDFDLILCAHPNDAGLLTLHTSARTFYDCPTPWADELYFEERLTERQHHKLRQFETRLYESVDALSFSWETYVGHVVDHYGVDDRNVVQLNWGCFPAEQRARFANPPRIVYLGSLTSRFIDLPLLSRLAKLYPHIDVYGGPRPDESLGLNYRGWAPPDVLEQYQLGLITCTQDELRRNGFSAKNLHYIAYGLPVLVPAWRRRMDLLRGSVPYDEHSFLEVIDSLSNEEEWTRVSEEAYAQAQRLTWDETLRPLDAFLRESSVERVGRTS